MSKIIYKPSSEARSRSPSLIGTRAIIVMIYVNNGDHETGYNHVALHKLSVDPDTTIGYVKDIIFDLNKVPASEQKLTRQGLKLEDQYLLSHYDIRDNDVIRMDYIELNLYITVRSWPGLEEEEDSKRLDFQEKTGFAVFRTDTIEKIKTMVMKDHEHLGSGDVCLMHGDKKLDETKMLMDYNIVDGDKMEIWRCYHATSVNALRRRLSNERLSNTSVIDEPSPSSV